MSRYYYYYQWNVQHVTYPDIVSTHKVAATYEDTSTYCLSWHIPVV
jgi:hypothetical protein